MRVLIQRVDSASVKVDGREVSRIGRGLLLFVGLGREDGSTDIEYMARKVSNIRIFPDEDDRLNLSVMDINGQILSVSQFTLYANTRKGNRPSFDLSAEPDRARRLWQEFNELLRRNGIDVREGVFGARMEVELINNGPVTIWLDSRA
jgi:D-tyrosyl-tRNA(Tyr) deacylase